jgi:hypothetical protein
MWLVAGGGVVVDKLTLLLSRLGRRLSALGWLALCSWRLCRRHCTLGGGERGV